MIDGLLIPGSISRDRLVDPTYTPDQAVVGRRLSGPKNAKRLTVLFPPWHGGDPAYKFMAFRLAVAGSAVLSYVFNDHILEPDIEKVLRSHDEIRRTAASDLRKLVEEKDYTHVHGISSSLGNVAFAHTAAEFTFSRATMIDTSSSLAASMWDGIRTQEVRKLFEAEGVDRQKLIDAWLPIAPATNVGAFEGMPVRQIISLSDEVIPTAHQWEMNDALRESGADLTTRTTHFGHYASIGTFCAVGL